MGAISICSDGLAVRLLCTACTGAGEATLVRAPVDRKRDPDVELQRPACRVVGLKDRPGVQALSHIERRVREERRRLEISEETGRSKSL